MIIVGVIITCFNRREKTIRCLTLLDNANKKSVQYKFDIFLVDDGSTDGTSDAVTMQFPNVNILKGDGNLFWNRGMNLAWKEASKINPDFYLWLNDDTFLFENSIEHLLVSSSEKKNQAIIVGTTKSEVSGLLTYGGRRESVDLIEPNANLEECYHFNGNVVLIPKSVFQKIGFLDNSFHHAIGDFDYGLRARKQNIKLFVSSSVNGTCERHDNFPKWCQEEIPFKERLATLYTSTCESYPKQIFIFNNRHYGLLKAISSIVSIHLRLLLPTIWNKKRVY